MPRRNDLLLPPLRYKRLAEVQQKIASRLVLQDGYDHALVAGVDQSFWGEMIISGAVVLDHGMRLLERAGSILTAAMPYRPGFLCFREGPAAVLAVRNLRRRPTLLFVDGCGINHPRRAGLACFVGLMLGMPAIGISKDVLCGSYDPPQEVGQAEPLIYDGDVVGYALLSLRGCRPIIVAPGHLVSVDSALELARFYLRGHKLPEPCRLAHEQARRMKLGFSPRPAANP